MIEKNIRLEPHHSRDLLVGRRSDNKRPKYQPPGHGTGGGRGRDNGGGGGGGGGEWHPGVGSPSPAPAPAPAPAPSPHRDEPVHVPTKPAHLGDTGGSIVVGTKPAHLGDTGGGLITLQPKNIHEGEQIIKPKIKKVAGPFDYLQKDSLVDLTNLGDDAKMKGVIELQKKADYDWGKKTEREKEEQQEKWDTAQEKLKSTKGGGVWKTLGNLALAVLIPALLPAKLASTYKLVKGASWMANKIGLTDTDIAQIVQQKTGKNISNLITEGKGLEKGAELLGLKKTDTGKEYTEKTIGKGDDRTLVADLSTAQKSVLDRPDVKFSYGEDPTGTIERLLNPGSGFKGHDIKEAPATKEDIENWYKATAAHGGRIDKPLTGRSRDI